MIPKKLKQKTLVDYTDGMINVVTIEKIRKQLATSFFGEVTKTVILTKLTCIVLPRGKTTQE